MDLGVGARMSAPQPHTSEWDYSHLTSSNGLDIAHEKNTHSAQRRRDLVLIIVCVENEEWCTLSVHVWRSAAASAGSDGLRLERQHAGREGSVAKSAEGSERGRQTWRCCSSVTAAKYYRMYLYVRGSVVQEKRQMLH